MRIVYWPTFTSYNIDLIPNLTRMSNKIVKNILDFPKDSIRARTLPKKFEYLQIKIIIIIKKLCWLLRQPCEKSIMAISKRYKQYRASVEFYKHNESLIQDYFAKEISENEEQF